MEIDLNSSLLHSEENITPAKWVSKWELQIQKLSKDEI